MTPARSNIIVTLRRSIASPKIKRQSRECNGASCRIRTGVICLEGRGLWPTGRTMLILTRYKINLPERDMAYLYSLSTECGPSKSDADSFASYFDGLTFSLLTGTVSKCQNRTFQDSEGNWWVIVMPDNISLSGVNTEPDYFELTECGLRLYERIKTAPTFRYSLAGVEVDMFSTYSEILNSVCTSPNGQKFFHNFPGLVLRQDVWQAAERPEGFWTFRPGFAWQPYQGEAFPFKQNKVLRAIWQDIAAIYDSTTNHRVNQIFAPE
jgi:hypothetical protein